MDRTYFHDRIPAVELEEWPERGHVVHLMEIERFRDRVIRFIDSLR